MNTASATTASSQSSLPVLCPLRPAIIVARRPADISGAGVYRLRRDVAGRDAQSGHAVHRALINTDPRLCIRAAICAIYSLDQATTTAQIAQLEDFKQAGQLSAYTLVARHPSDACCSSPMAPDMPTCWAAKPSGSIRAVYPLAGQFTLRNTSQTLAQVLTAAGLGYADPRYCRSIKPESR